MEIAVYVLCGVLMSSSIKFLSRDKHVHRLLLAFMFSFFAGSSAISQVNVGVYYFPGWSPSTNWDRIKPYSDKQPNIGWYDSDDPQVMREQVGQMINGGIDYVIFDEYIDSGSPHANKPIDNFIALKTPDIKFGILWANDYRPVTKRALVSDMEYWNKEYFSKATYLRIDGRPILLILSPENLSRDLAKDGMSLTDALSQMRRLARSYGYSDLYIISCIDDFSRSASDKSIYASGFDAVSAYNLHRPPFSSQDPNWAKLTHGYAELDAAYRKNWSDGEKGRLPFIVPVTVGWDRRPWGGSADPLHDRSLPNAQLFAAHLKAAKSEILTGANVVDRMALICCWNEYGEGSVLEPTASQAYLKLSLVRSILSDRQ